MKLLILTVLISFANSELEQSTTKFAQKLYKVLSKTERGNFLISPLSAGIILSLVQQGAKDSTAEEISQLLKYPDPLSIKTVLSELAQNEQYTYQSANKIYLKRGFKVKPSFQQIATESYGTTIEDIDFIKPTAADTINKWVEKQTNDKIKNLIKSSELDKYTRAVLVNALYFQANWSLPFLLSETAKQNFHISTTEKVEVEMMNHHEQYFNYFECPHIKAQYLELPFKHAEATLTIVLPSEIGGLAKLENELNRVFYSMHLLSRTYVNVAVPRFKTETSINLKTVLKKLGVTKLFNEAEADLSSLSGSKGDLYVSEASQKTFIDISEEGVEATASTYFVLAVPTSLVVNKPQPKVFRADRPFIYYIKINNLVAFVGRVTTL